ncbi:SMC-Scp complex subunit ScpB [candidate division WOR-3 bacterium]|nr:SMC-Scp complex subunit ScpB [candidate division WOR-3 bacterium]
MEKDIKRYIEAVLFAAESPVSISLLKKILGIDSIITIRNAIEELNNDYAEHSFEIRQVAKGYRIYTKPEYSDIIKEMKKDRDLPNLSTSSLETLAIIAYKQPITKNEIEHIRGVSSDGVLKTLLNRDLIKVLGKSDLPGKPMLYGTTNHFLEYFGLKNLEDIKIIAKEIWDEFDEENKKIFG